MNIIFSFFLALLLASAAVKAQTCELEPWTLTSSMTRARSSGFGLVTWDGYIYAIAGNYNNDVEMAQIMSNGSLGPWTQTSPMLIGRAGEESVVHNSYIYVFGGYRSPQTAECELAPVLPDHTLGPWELIHDLPIGYSSPVPVVAGDWVYLVAMGYAANLNDLYPGGPPNPWVIIPPTNFPRGNSAAVSDGQYIYVVGGGSLGSTNTTEVAQVLGPGVLSPWQLQASNLNVPRDNLSVGLMNNCIFAVGGGALPIG